MKNNVQKASIQEIFNTIYIEHFRLSVSCPETKNLISTKSQKRKRLQQPNFVG